MVRRISENLYIGNADQARQSGEEFDHIISMATPPKCSTHQFCIPDGEHDYTIFANAVEQILESVSTNHKTLVHCQAGISRSVSVTIAAYTCLNETVSYNQAFEECRHGFMYPHENLLKSARKYIDENNCS